MAEVIYHTALQMCVLVPCADLMNYWWYRMCADLYPYIYIYMYLYSWSVMTTDHAGYQQLIQRLAVLAVAH